MILRNLWRRGMRSSLTILGIAVGVAAVVALGAMAQGITQSYGGALGLQNDLLVAQKDAYDIAFSNLDETIGDRIRSVPDVTNVDPGVFAWQAVGNTPFFLVYGYEPNSVAATHYRIVEGKHLTSDKQIVIGQRAADALEKRIGDTIRLNGVPYRIVGIYETGQAMEESGGLVTLDDGKQIGGKERSVSLFQVGVRRGADVNTVIERIQKIDDGITVTKSSEYEAGEQWSSYMNGFAWGVAGIAVLVGGLGMMSAMVMSVMERTREIGTLRAVGWSRRRVVRLVMGEAIGLSLVGGLIGVALGVGMATAVAQIPGVGSFLEGSFSPALFAQGMGTALVLGVVGGAYPAWTAANLQPVEALRYEGGSSGAPAGRWARIGNQSFRNLWRRRTRTIISAAGIGIGVATLVMLGGMIDGMIGQLNGLAGAGGMGHLTVMQREVADMSLSSLDERIVRQIEVMPYVRSATPALLGFISNKEFPIFIVMGIDPNSGARRHYKIQEGRALQRPNEIEIGRLAADTYKVGVGDTLQLYNNRYKIVGIYETGSTWEDGGANMALSEAQRLLGRQRSVSFIFVDVDDPTRARAVADAINQRFPEARASLSSEFAQSTNDLQNSEAMMNAIRLLALIVGGIVVANTMIMSIFERTREIGTLRALGWRPRRIVGQVVQESLFLCLLAALLGSVLGVALLEGVSHLPVVSSMITPAWGIGTFAFAVGVSLFLGILGGVWPAWRASRLQPVEALRYE